LGAIAVIALFYTDTIHTQPLLIGATLIIFSFILGQFGVRTMWPYALLGIAVWIAFLESGIHATIAGVLLAFSIPHTARYETHNFTARLRTLLHRFDDAEREWDKEPGGRKPIHDVIVNARQQALLRNVLDEVHYVEAPLQRLEHNLEPLVVFVILPLFAFANAGVSLNLSSIGELARHPVTLGTLAGLTLGKPLGIFAACFLLVKMRVAELPRGVTWVQVIGVGALAGIGFTMSLFVNGLAFVGHDPETREQLVEAGKMGVFGASIVSVTVGLGLLSLTSRTGGARRKRTDDFEHAA
jgi:NhaA family Na+:H+ antiporter